MASSKVICQATHGSYLVHVIGGGQYRYICDHTCECLPDAVKHDTSTTPIVAPATAEALPALPAANPPEVPAAPVASTTPSQPAAPAATTNTPCKSPVVSSQPQMPPTGDIPKLTGTAPVFCQSTRVRKPTSRLFEQIWFGLTPNVIPDELLIQTTPC